jgi:multiple sugar transport system permease protein
MMATQAITTAGTPRRRRRFTGGVGSDGLAGWLFAAPAIIGFAAFFVWPALRGAYFSFTEYSLLGQPDWVGFANYERLIGDSVFWNALAVAVLLHRLTQSIVVRGIMLVPYMIANVIAALVWFYMFDYQIGVVNEFISWVGLDRLAFFGDSALAIPTIAFINVWRHLGYTALLIFAGLQMIPKDVYEAGALDGAGELRMFRSITLPLLRPVLAMVLVVTVTGAFQVFDTVAVTTSGGPVNATRVINFYIYDVAFTRGEFGYGSALAMALFVLLAVFTYIQLRATRANQSDLG